MKSQMEQSNSSVPAQLRRRGIERKPPEAPKNSSRFITIWLTGILAALFCLGIFLVFRGRPAADDPKTPILAAEYYVKAKVGPGSITKFSPPEWTKVETVEDTVKVSGWVEVVPKNGMPSTSYNYECVLRNDRESGSWLLVALDGMRQ
jgi:hypothetical protein